MCTVINGAPSAAVSRFDFVNESNNKLFQEVDNDKKNAQEALDHKDKGEKLKIACHHYNEGCRLEHGNQVNKDVAEAFKKYKTAVEIYKNATNGETFVFAEYNLAMCYANGIGTKQDFNKAYEHFQNAVKQDFVPAIMNLARLYDLNKIAGKSTKDAAELYQKVAAKSNAIAQYHLGYCYEFGRGIKEDQEEAIKYYKLSADQNFEKAQNQLWNLYYKIGLNYYYGKGVTKDVKKATECFKLASDHNIANAQTFLGYCHENGLGTDNNINEAYKYYKLSADQKNAEGQFFLGRSYEYGLGIEKDEKKAFKYYQLSANQGYNQAQFFLGGCYERGIGVEKDEGEAVKFYYLALGNDYVQAGEGLNRLLEKPNLKEHLEKFKVERQFISGPISNTQSANFANNQEHTVISNPAEDLSFSFGSEKMISPSVISNAKEVNEELKTAILGLDQQKQYFVFHIYRELAGSNTIYYEAFNFCLQNNVCNPDIIFGKKIEKENHSADYEIWLLLKQEQSQYAFKHLQAAALQGNHMNAAFSLGEYNEIEEYGKKYALNLNLDEAEKCYKIALDLGHKKAKEKIELINLKRIALSCKKKIDEYIKKTEASNIDKTKNAKEASDKFQNIIRETSPFHFEKLNKIIDDYQDAENTLVNDPFNFYIGQNIGNVAQYVAKKVGMSTEWGARTQTLINELKSMLNMHFISNSKMLTQFTNSLKVQTDSFNVLKKVLSPESQNVAKTNAH